MTLAFEKMAALNDLYLFIFSIPNHNISIKIKQEKVKEDTLLSNSHFALSRYSCSVIPCYFRQKEKPHYKRK